MLWRKLTLEATHPDVQTHAGFCTCVTHQKTVKIRVIKSLSCRAVEKERMRMGEEDDGGEREEKKSRRECIYTCHFAPVPKSRGDVTGQFRGRADCDSGLVCVFPKGCCPSPTRHHLTSSSPSSTRLGRPRQAVLSFALQGGLCSTGRSGGRITKYVLPSILFFFLTNQVVSGSPGPFHHREMLGLPTRFVQ